MALTTLENDARFRLENYNAGTYHSVSNPYGQAGEGYQINYTREGMDIAIYGAAVVRESAAGLSAAAAAAVDRAAVAVDRTAVATDRAATELARDQAEVSATSTQFPVANSGGTGSAYTATLSGFTLADGASFRLNLSATNASAATLNVNGTGAKGLVAEDGRSVVGGEMLAGYTVIVTYEQNTNKWIVMGLPRSKWAFDVNANGKRLNNLRGLNRQILYRGPLAPQEDILVAKFLTATRLHGLPIDLSAGIANLIFFKNGVAISFGGTTAVGVTTALTTFTPDGGYIDFAPGDLLRMDIQGVAAGATTLSAAMDTTEAYSA